METVVIWIAVATGIYMAWNIGANDVANAMGTSVGSGALTLRRAIIVAGIFELAGAVMVGGHVTETVRKGILDPTLFMVTGAFGAEGPFILALGMAAALLAAAIWLQIATMAGLPVSTTHSIVGAVVGFGLVAVGADAVEWAKLGQIAASWVVSPALGGLLGYLTFVTIRRHILHNPDPVKATIRLAPYIIMVVGTILALTFVYKALKNVVPDPHPFVTILAALGVGGVAALVSRRIITPKPDQMPRDPQAYVEKVFAGLQIVTAAFVAFAHGSNDVANAVGPLAAVLGIASEGFTDIPSSSPVPIWVLALGGVGIVVGLATWGYKVIATIGKHITEITPTRGFAAEFGAATTVLMASRLGMPISTTHTLVGAVIGVGFAQGIGALNMRTIRNIINSWIATLPAAAGLSALIFVIFRSIFL